MWFDENIFVGVKMNWIWKLVIAVIIIIIVVWIFYELSRNQSTATPRFSATLNGAQVVPPTISTATGSGTAVLTGNSLEYNFRTTPLSSPVTSATFNLGTIGNNGPVVKALSYAPQADGTVLVRGVWAASDATQALADNLISALQRGGIYVTVATANFPSGEIRGQLNPLVQS